MKCDKCHYMPDNFIKVNNEVWLHYCKDINCFIMKKTKYTKQELKTLTDKIDDHITKKSENGVFKRY